MKKNQNEELIKYGKYAVLGLVGFAVLKPILSAAKSVSQSVVTSAEQTAKQQVSGLTKQELTLCADVAKKVEASLSSGWFGMFEDEEAVVVNLNRLSTMEQAMETSDVYFKNTDGDSLAADVNSYLSTSDQMRILSAVKSGLK